MKTFVRIAVLGLALGFSAQRTFAAEPLKPELAAQASAQEWLALVDVGKYAESWEKMSGGFKDEVSKRKWNSTISQVRKPLGKVVTRTLKSAEYKKELPGAPEGEYVVSQFETTFEKKPAATETVTLVLGQDLIWRVSSYAVK